ncbi:hypothetical protein CJ207_09790, partial [Klebsiella aerogenes]
DHQVSVTFPQPDHVTADGYSTWLTSINDLGLQHRMTAFGNKNHIVMIDPVSFIDVIATGQEKIHTILFGTEHDQVVISSQPLDPAVWTRIKNLHSETLTLNDTVYRVHIIPELGLGVASWSSTQPLDARLRQQ